MKRAQHASIIAVMLFVALAIPLGLAAQDDSAQAKKHHHYQLIDLGTFGGPNSYVATFDVGALQALNDRGAVAGSADTSTPDPYPNFCFNDDCFVSHAFQWQNGVLTDLGTLPGGTSSGTTWISASHANSEECNSEPRVVRYRQSDAAAFWSPHDALASRYGGATTEIGRLQVPPRWNVTHKITLFRSMLGFTRRHRRRS